MRIEKLRSNKIKITFSQEDMILHGLTHELVAKNAPSARAIFWDVLKKAEDEIGFDIGDGRLMIEAMPGADESLILYITKLDSGEDILPLRKKVRLKVKNSGEANCLMFSSFDNVIEMFKAFPDLSGGALYLYKEKYYLIMPESPALALSEFGKKADSLYIADILSEHGKLICENAAETIKKYF